MNEPYWDEIREGEAQENPDVLRLQNHAFQVVDLVDENHCRWSTICGVQLYCS